MLRLLKHLNIKEWLLVILSLLLVLIQVGLDLTLPDYMHEITELAEESEPSMQEILHTGVKMLLAALGSLAAALLTALLASRAAASYCAKLRQRIFDHVAGLSVAQRQRYGVSGLVNRTANDVLQVQLAAVLALEVMVKAPILAVWAVIKIGMQERAGGLWIAALGVGTMALLVALCVGICMPQYRKMQRLTDDLGRITREGLQGMHTVRALNGEAYEEERFEQVNEELTKTHLFTAHTTSILLPGTQLINSLLTLGVYYIGMLSLKLLAPEARLSLFSDVVVFLSYILRIATAFLLVASVSALLPRAQVCAGRIRRLLATPIEKNDGTLDKAPLQGEVELRHVSFLYPEAEEYMLQDISVAAHRGETIGIVGTSGCGKSTLLALLPRFLSPTEGEVLVDGIDVQKLELTALRDKIGYVAQEPFLFSGSIKENVALGMRSGEVLSEQQYRELLRVVCAEELIEQDGFVREGGKNLSEGQAQQVALARALAGRPEFLILDDAFSFFDHATSRGICHSIRAAYPALTILMTAQRAVNVQSADRIFVMHHGRLLACGTHASLLQECEEYRRIVAAQEGRGAEC